MLDAKTGVYSTTGVAARLQLWKTPNENSIEQRLNALEHNQKELLRTIDETNVELRAETGAIRTALKQEKGTREADLAKFSKRLEGATVDGVDDLYLAAALTVVSTLLDTIGPNNLEPVFRAMHLF